MSTRPAPSTTTSTGNTSPVQGRLTGVAGSDRWLFAAFYDDIATNTYLCAGRPRRPGEPHSNPVSWFTLAKFSATLEKVTVDTVEAGDMTKDLALLVGAEQKWLTTTGFLDKIDQNLKKAMAA